MYLFSKRHLLRIVTNNMMLGISSNKQLLIFVQQTNNSFQNSSQLFTMDTVILKINILQIFNFQNYSQNITLTLTLTLTLTHLIRPDAMFCGDLHVP